MPRSKVCLLRHWLHLPCLSDRRDVDGLLFLGDVSSRVSGDMSPKALVHLQPLSLLTCPLVLWKEQTCKPTLQLCHHFLVTVCVCALIVDILWDDSYVEVEFVVTFLCEHKADICEYILEWHLSMSLPWMCPYPFIQDYLCQVQRGTANGLSKMSSFNYRQVGFHHLSIITARSGFRVNWLNSDNSHKQQSWIARSQSTVTNHSHN